jgi:hypothetical protein
MRFATGRPGSATSAEPEDKRGRNGIMCLSCGCGEPNDDHGDRRHITQDQLEQAAQAAQISPQDAAQNILDGLQAADAART